MCPLVTYFPEGKISTTWWRMISSSEIVKQIMLLFVNVKEIQICHQKRENTITLENITNRDISVMPSIGCCCPNCHAARLPTQTYFLSVSLLAHLCIILCILDLGAMVGCDLFLETVILWTWWTNKSLKKNYINFSETILVQETSPTSLFLFLPLLYSVLLLPLPSLASDFLGEVGQESVMFC